MLKGLVRCASCGYAMVVLARPKYGWEGTSYACQMSHKYGRCKLDAYIEVADVATLGREGFQRGVTARKEAVARARRAVRDAEPPDESKMPKFEADWTDADHREELRRFVEKVVVTKADPKKRRWQPVGDRVEVVWRGAS